MRYPQFQTKQVQPKSKTRVQWVCPIRRRTTWLHRASNKIHLIYNEKVRSCAFSHMPRQPATVNNNRLCMVLFGGWGGGNKKDRGGKRRYPFTLKLVNCEKWREHWNPCESCIPTTLTALSRLYTRTKSFSPNCTFSPTRTCAKH